MGLHRRLVCGEYGQRKLLPERLDRLLFAAIDLQQLDWLHPVLDHFQHRLEIQRDYHGCQVPMLGHDGLRVCRVGCYLHGRQQRWHTVWPNRAHVGVLLRLSGLLRQPSVGRSLQFRCHFDRNEDLLRGRGSLLPQSCFRRETVLRAMR